MPDRICYVHPYRLCKRDRSFLGCSTRQVGNCRTDLKHEEGGEQQHRLPDGPVQRQLLHLPHDVALGGPVLEGAPGDLLDLLQGRVVFSPQAQQGLLRRRNLASSRLWTDLRLRGEQW